MIELRPIPNRNGGRLYNAGRGDAIFTFNGSEFLWKVNPAIRSATRLMPLSRTYRFLAISEGRGKIFFVTARALSLFQFGHIDLVKESIQFDGEVDYSKLDDRAPIRRYNAKDIRIHGCVGGIIMISTNQNNLACILKLLIRIYRQ